MPNVSVLPSDGTPLADAVRWWLDASRAVNRTPRTIATREYVMYRVFLPWCEEHGITSLEQVTSRVLNAYSADLQSRTSKKGQPYSKNTVASYVREANALLSWANKDEELRTQPAKGGVPVAPQTIVQVLTEAEVEAMIAAANNQRDKLIVQVLWQTGMRASELLLLRCSDLALDGRHRVLRVQGKGRGGQGRPRHALVTPALYRALERYAADRSGPLWLALRKSPASGQHEPLQLSGLEHMIGFLGKAAGIDRPVHPHLFRHSITTKLLKKGLSPSMIKQTLGWTTTQMIDRRYGHLVDSDTYDALSRALLEP